MRNENGFNLIEMMLALTILLIALMGLVQASLLSMDSILRNSFRDEAVRIAEMRLTGELRSAPPAAPISSLDPDLSSPAPASRSANQVGGAADRGLKNLPFDTLRAMINLNWVCTSNSGDRVWGGNKAVAKGYNVCWQVVAIPSTTDVVGINVAVGWNHKLEVPVASRPAPTGREFQHRITSYVRRPEAS